MKCVAVVNQKGGVGKTTTCINLGAELADLGYRVLLVDSDPQGNCSSGVGYDRRQDRRPTIYQVLCHHLPAQEALWPTAWPGLTLLPGDINMAGAEIELAGIPDREWVLRKALTPLQEHFDLALIDCPPSLGLMTINALAAADRVLVPVQSEFFALEGLMLLSDTIVRLSRGLGRSLDLDDLLVTLYDGRTTLANDVSDSLEQWYGSKVLSTRIPRNVAVAEAPSFRMPLRYHAVSSFGAKAYRALALEVISRWQLTKEV